MSAKNVLLSLNKLFPLPVHPFNLQNEGKMSYAEWQFLKGAEQIALEGAIQIFKIPYTGMEEVIVGVVGTLQFDVFQYRLRNEYNVEIRMDTLPYEYLRWIKEPVEFHETDLVLGNDTKLVEDYKGNKLLLFSYFWSIKWVTDHTPQLVLPEFNERTDEED